jgi:hypothetical protein
VGNAALSGLSSIWAIAQQADRARPPVNQPTGNQQSAVNQQSAMVDDDIYLSAFPTPTGMSLIDLAPVPMS